MSMIMRLSPASLLGLPLAGFLAPRSPGKAPPAERTEPTMRALPRASGTWPRPVVDEDPQVARLLAAAKVAPALSLIEWDFEHARAEPAASLPTLDGIAIADEGGADDPNTFEPRRRKIRDRYVSARFPGVARSGLDLRAPDRVVKAARLYFEEDDAEAALELLQLAIEEVPHESALWLARLELLFLTRDRERFVAAARAFRAAHPHHDAWQEVARLGRAIAPEEGSLFGASTEPREHDHYGPWPHLPNWIQAPWDLTADVVAADFHRGMTRLASADSAANAD